MKIKYLIPVIAGLAITQHSYAQYAQDALRFSTGQPGGSARIKALGNAGTAIGGDLSSIGNNPAGLGAFTHSEFSLTPELNSSKVSANYFGSNNAASKDQLNLSNASLVLYQRLNTAKGADKSQGWLSLNFGVGYNRTNNFYQNTFYSGRNPNTSIANYYAEQGNANGIATGSLQRGAYDQLLIDNYGTTAAPVYRSNVVGGGPVQTKNAYETGGQSEIDLSMGANYSNKLYLGFGIDITDLRYNSTRFLNEQGLVSVIESGAPVNRAYNSTYEQDQATRGTGFNARFGLIYKPVDAVRIGASFTTPTWYNIDDAYAESLNSTVANHSVPQYGPASYPFNYNLRTPLKVAGGIAVFVGKLGFITGDVEYQDYSSIHLSASGNSGVGDNYFNADNNDVKNLYRSVVNAHVGAEIKADQFYLRGGYGVQGNPLRQYGGEANTVSGGIGYRFGGAYIDATYSHVSSTSTVFPYELTTATNYGAGLKNTFNNVFLTLGFAL
ncbi:OmpP1/FadL family transporter [Mucilaginibacter ginkgonis]|uniref:Long-subunit fatty acid transport protein n=1 Tax=Mucilaginibacter ginkgonis TaxID=2682091 RepID=A0A6I4I099_9SPHI|nr:hypothetical protein [Mucilaginibacter ginkgonis]QQL50991.1 hypothetical protein GO620_005940 [Mucilaginibacter ginkgonis]